MKVVGISGAQGAGKSSLLAELKRRGFNVDDFKVSRAVQEELGWGSLDRVMEEPHTMHRFQQLVWQRKYNHDLALTVKLPEFYEQQEHRDITRKSDEYKNEIVLTERTFADLSAYTTLWALRHAKLKNIEYWEASELLCEYNDACSTAQNRIYSGVVLLPYMKHIEWEDDVKRASHEDVQTVYDSVKFFTNTRSLNLAQMTIATKSIAERADEVETFLRTL